MPCDTRLKPRQTISQRKAEVKRTIETLAAKLAAGRAQAKVDRATGAIAFAGLSEAERDGVTDACAYRLIMATGSVAAKMAIMRAEQMAGRTVNREAIAQGIHSHDGGATFHHGH